MKRIVLLVSIILTATATLSAQKVVRLGVDIQNGKVTISQPKSTLAIELCTEERTFTPGVYARYAQKLLGVRASLAQRTESVIVSASVSLMNERPASVKQQFDNPSVDETTLPANRIDSRAQSVEEQAQATANRIFSLRKTRLDLISGEVGENVFGAGMQAALAEIDRIENEYLEMFYGTTTVTNSCKKFMITPVEGTFDYPLCRYRNDAGIVGVGDLNGELVVLHIEPDTTADLSALPLPDKKSKHGVEHLVVTPSLCTLFSGTRALVGIELPLYQFGKRVKLDIPEESM